MAFSLDDSLLVTVGRQLARSKWHDVELVASERLRTWCRDEPQTVRKVVDILALFVDALEELLSEEQGGLERHA